MKKIYLSTLAFALIGLTMTACNEDASKVESTPLTTPQQKVGYSIGTEIGTQVAKQLAAIKDDFDQKAFIAGLNDAMTGTEFKLTQDEMYKATNGLQEQIARKAQENKIKAQEEMMKASQSNIAEGVKFLAENTKKEGVVTLASGLQYKIIKAGSGAKPTAEDTVVTHYTGKLINGKVFDSSVQRGQPATFPVKGVIAGWTEALQLMTTGSKWELYIPAKLAYGERGAGQDIAPNATLIFEIELLEIKK